MAVRLAQEGANVIINYRSPQDSAQETENQIKALGRESLSFQADVTKPEEVQAMVDAGIQKFGKIDILVNNAGVEKHAPFVDVTEQDYDLVMDVNLKGAFFTAQAVVRTMIAKKVAGESSI